MSEFTSVTRCPYCRTSFHLGPMQLDAAGGKVRCGACLNVFDAREHFLVEQKNLFDSLPAPPPQATSAPDWDAEAEVDSSLTDAFTAAEENDEDGGEDEFDVAAIREDEPEAWAAEQDLYPLMTDERPPRRVSRWWPTLVIAGLLLLPLQALWWQPAGLLQQGWYRELLNQRCNWLLCTLSGFRDLEYLSLSGLILPSTTYQQALTARLELRNQGPLPQPYPSLAIRFMNLRGELIASRLVAPSEYLRSEASGRRYIGAQQRVQIEVELFDPGRDAVSYEFEPIFPLAD